jgi:hypothetical protein
VRRNGFLASLPSHTRSDKKGKVLGTGVIKVNDFFTLNNVTLVDRLRYNPLSVSQLVDADLYVLF